MVNYLKQKQLGIPFILIIGLIIAGFMVSSVLQTRNILIKNKINKKAKKLEKYLRQGNIVPDNQIVDELKDYKEFIVTQQDDLIDILQKRGDFSAMYEEVITPLEVKELIANIREQLNMDNIGFAEYLKDVPAIIEINDLKRQISMIDKIVKTAKKNNILNIKNIVRLDKKKIKFSKKTFAYEFSCVVEIICKYSDLINFLYEISVTKEFLITKGIEIKTSADTDKQIDVILRLSYIEMGK
jgi:hypothetical protein